MELPAVRLRIVELAKSDFFELFASVEAVHIPFDQPGQHPGMADQVASDGRLLCRYMIVFLFDPFEQQVDPAARLVDGFQRLLGASQDGKLSFTVAWLSQSAAHGCAYAGQARHAHCGGQVRDIGNSEGGKAGRFDLALYQSDGPVAQGSGRHQQNNFYRFLLETIDDGWGCLIKQDVRLQVVPHERISAGC